ncbi:hypothetical protein TWF696_008154 [Orbilia brochopaga]|uniref:Uncharacterized protein n=1 Tax=Orbilia brochopaga TaxID=3140254 RepID=A0AAV9UPP7_9PEZI
MSPTVTPRRERLRLKAERLQRSSEYIDHRNAVLQTLIRPTQELGAILRRLANLNSIDELLDDLRSTGEFEDFLKLWDSKNIDIPLREVLNKSITQTVLKNCPSDEASSDSTYMGLSVWTISDPDDPPDLPIHLFGLPWFTTGIHQKTDVRLDCRDQVANTISPAE